MAEIIARKNPAGGRVQRDIKCGPPLPGDYEIMILPEGGNGEEIVSTHNNSGWSTTHLRQSQEACHVHELKGRYKKLADDLKAALACGLERKGDDDRDTSNFDAPAITLCGWVRKKVEAAAKTAGLGCFVWNLWGSKFYVFPIRHGVGQGMTRSKEAEAMREYLTRQGYDAMTYCQSD